MIPSSFTRGLMCCILVVLISVGSMPLIGNPSVGTNAHPIGSETAVSRLSSRAESRSIEIILHGGLGENGWYVGPVEFEVIGTNGTVIFHMYYRIDGGAWTEFTSPVVFPTDFNGIHLLEVMVIDQNGTEYNASAEIKIDTTLPTIELQKERISLNKMTFIANVSDSPSGVWLVEFYLDCALVASEYEPPYEWTWKGSGYHTVTATVFDRAGNSASSSISTPCLQSSVQNNLVFQRSSPGLQFLIPRFKQ
jgi:hypothetical protein